MWKVALMKTCVWECFVLDGATSSPTTTARETQTLGGTVRTITDAVVLPVIFRRVNNEMSNLDVEEALLAT